MVSLFADIASEMLYPVIPLYLKSIGMGAIYIGILEGIADFTAGMSKSFFGKWSDQIGKRLPFVWSGYLLSSVSKSLIALFNYPWWILLTRSLDRLGKGIRTSSRDAILSMEATKDNKGAIFGFHRAMDTTGAFLGPIIALIYLHYHPGEYKKIFFYSLIPAIFVITFLWLVKEKKIEKKVEKKNIFIASFSYWIEASAEYKKAIVMICLFTLSNSSDMFLLLKARDVVGNDFDVIRFYILYNIIYASSSYYIGKLSDKIGKKKTYSLGLLFFAMAYLLIGTSHSLPLISLGFILYGLFSAATEGVSKAWISSLCHESDLGVALGFQNTTQSICAMLASFLAGGIWQQWGSIYVFLFSASVAIMIAVYNLFNKYS